MSTYWLTTQAVYYDFCGRQTESLCQWTSHIVLIFMFILSPVTWPGGEPMSQHSSLTSTRNWTLSQHPGECTGNELCYGVSTLLQQAWDLKSYICWDTLSFLDQKWAEMVVPIDPPFFATWCRTLCSYFISIFWCEKLTTGNCQSYYFMCT